MNDTVEKVVSREDKPHRFHTFAFKLRAVKLRLEEGIRLEGLSRELDVSASSIMNWCKQYQEHGEAGLHPVNRRGPRKPLPDGLRDSVLRIKRESPSFGIKRISQTLRRIFFIGANPKQVRRALTEAGIESPGKVNGRKRNIRKPRFFERSTPNQMWQSDICMFKLGGKYAYLIGYIDDYSRFIVGLELYMSQRSVNVLEVYRRSASEYKPPREMLTDNGRQYASWRGTTDFEREMKRDGIKHIKSRPHHPMTLGKIERFWKTIFQEFLLRAQFESFEEARERIRYWVKYYNHKRPHQGIGGLCPADRYFEVDVTLRKVIEQGIADNTLEMALRGKPNDPFYMVGRMNGQSVMLTVEKGKLRLSVDGKDGLAYSVKEDIKEGGLNGKGDKKELGSVQCEGENEGSAVGMDGVKEAGLDMPGASDKMGCILPVGRESIIRDASGFGAEDEHIEGGSSSDAPSEFTPEEGEADNPEDN